MPVGDLADVERSNSKISCPNRMNVRTELSHRCWNVSLGKPGFDYRQRSEMDPVLRSLELDTVRHPDPRLCDLQKTSANISDFHAALQIDHRFVCLTLYSLPLAAREVRRSSNPVDDRVVTTAGVLRAVRRNDIDGPVVRTFAQLCLDDLTSISLCIDRDRLDRTWNCFEVEFEG